MNEVTSALEGIRPAETTFSSMTMPGVERIPYCRISAISVTLATLASTPNSLIASRTSSSTFLPGIESQLQPSLKLVISEKGGLPARSLSGFAAPTSVLLVVGPEGGWAHDEISLFQDAGFMEIFLGGRILRSETAALAAVTLAQFLWGDLGIP